MILNYAFYLIFKQAMNFQYYNEIDLFLIVNSYHIKHNDKNLRQQL